MVHKIIQVFGRVQGVGFRFAAKRMAESLKINGLVKNNYDDGSVYIEAEGNIEQINDYIQWCWKGPTNAYVMDVIVDDGELKNYDNFYIRF